MAEKGWKESFWWLERKGSSLLQQGAWRQSKAPCSEPKDQERRRTQGFLLRQNEGLKIQTHKRENKA
jgi:hypothetical protein